MDMRWIYLLTTSHEFGWVVVLELSDAWWNGRRKEKLFGAEMTLHCRMDTYYPPQFALSLFPFLSYPLSLRINLIPISINLCFMMSLINILAETQTVKRV